MINTMLGLFLFGLSWSLYAVLPLDREWAVLLWRQACSSAGKRPLIASGSKVASTDPQTIPDWCANSPRVNIGIATDSVSGLIVVDVDAGPNKSGYSSLAALETEQAGIPRKDCGTTSSGGLHIYPSAPQAEIRNCASKFAAHIDILVEGGYVVALALFTSSATETLGKRQMLTHIQLPARPNGRSRL